MEEQGASRCAEQMVPVILSHGSPRLDATLAGSWRTECVLLEREAEVEREEGESGVIRGHYIRVLSKGQMMENCFSLTNAAILGWFRFRTDTNGDQI